jgi:hypothetical protein
MAEPEALAMPLHHGRRLDQYHRVDDLAIVPIDVEIGEAALLALSR